VRNNEVTDQYKLISTTLSKDHPPPALIIGPQTTPLAFFWDTDVQKRKHGFTDTCSSRLDIFALVPTATSRARGGESPDAVSRHAGGSHFLGSSRVCMFKFGVKVELRAKNNPKTNKIL